MWFPMSTATFRQCLSFVSYSTCSVAKPENHICSEASPYLSMRPRVMGIQHMFPPRPHLLLTCIALCCS